MRNFHEFNTMSHREWYLQGYMEALNDWREWLAGEIIADD